MKEKGKTSEENLFEETVAANFPNVEKQISRSRKPKRAYKNEFQKIYTKT